MPKAKDITNKTFGFLTALKPSDKRDACGSIIWKCRCVCSKIHFVSNRLLSSGNTQSCGCKRYELAGDAISAVKTTHGASRRGTTSQLAYSLWMGMKSRCYNKNHKSYKRYGGRGIKVCKKWKESFEEFLQFIKTLPNRPSDDVLSSRGRGKQLKVSLDRINNDKDYKPGNIKWSTKKEQCNNRSSNVIVKVYGKAMTLTEACEKYAVVSYGTVHLRINRYGWCTEKALTTPSRIKEKQKN